MKNNYDIIVVGGGPAGSVAARYAAEKGVSVLILEKDREIGTPVRCAEGTSHEGIKDFIDIDPSFIDATINKFCLVSPEGERIEISLDQVGYILNRKVFDFKLAQMAANAGCEIYTKAYVNGLLFDNDKVAGIKVDYMGIQKEIKAKVVIAADGVESRVGRWAGIKTYIDFRDIDSCVQYTASNVNDINEDTLYFHFGQSYAPGGYLWIFPKGGNNANIGLGVSGAAGKKKSALSYLNDFMNKKYPDTAILTTVAGGVPCVPTLEKIAAPGIILVGDAARQTNPLTGGGIASGMIGGSIGGKIAAESILNNKPDFLLSYEKAWDDRLGKRHVIFNNLKEGIYNFSDKDFIKLSKAMSKIPYEKRSIGGLFQKALMNNPKLLIDVAKLYFTK
ncbi:MAG: NAD(P)/FAD-dependent oxidoreductase [Melioribacteraceae bacterium]|nr:NAD(P)/FAD-dependent oxidoreductase [Melioribacteraceae bacterium]